MALVDKFHRAASDGYLDLLREATKRELNQVDEDGITPTHSAAASGHLDALRIIIGRGGNPDKSDYLGRTALHHAAKKGHLDCVSYLVNWGCNIWALDNSHHDAFDVSTLNNKKDIFNYLDKQRNIQLQKNRKTVDKQKEKAIIEYDRNVKRYEKLQLEASRKAEKENRRIRGMQQTEGEGSPAVKTTIKEKLKTFAYRTKRRPQAFPHYTESRGNGGTRQSIFNVKELDETGNVKVHSLTGIMSGSDVLYVNGKPETQQNDYDRDDEEGNSKVASIFDRPGMGKMAFLAPRRQTSMNLDAEDSLNKAAEEEQWQGHTAMTLRHTVISSAQPKSSMAAKIQPRATATDLPWDDDIIGAMDEDDDEALTKYSSLELFLVTFNLQDYLDVFTREKIDLGALVLLEDEDLKSLSVEMGPRRKLKIAIERRKQAIRNPGAMIDSRI